MKTESGQLIQDILLDYYEGCDNSYEAAEDVLDTLKNPEVRRYLLEIRSRTVEMMKDAVNDKDEVEVARYRKRLNSLDELLNKPKYKKRTTR